MSKERFVVLIWNQTPSRVPNRFGDNLDDVVVELIALCLDAGWEITFDKDLELPNDQGYSVFFDPDQVDNVKQLAKVCTIRGWEHRITFEC